MEKVVTVAVTGAGGQIGYSLLFRLASGEVFGEHTKVRLRLVELPEAIRAAEGTAMELIDCGFKTLASVDCFDTAEKGFEGTNWALLVGAKPRGKGMERSDLIRSNGPIFVGQGRALNKAASDVRVIVVGNPCNTNALIAQHNCREVPANRFFAMTALDENRAKAQLAVKASVSVGEVHRLTIWGNHSNTMHPDFENATISGKPLTTVISDRKWLEGEFMSSVQNRGAAIIEARGKSSAASAASGCVDNIKNLLTKTASGDWFSAAIPSDGTHYGVPKGVVYSFPLRSRGDGSFDVVSDLPLTDYARQKLKATADELLKERELVKDLLG